MPGASFRSSSERSVVGTVHLVARQHLELGWLSRGGPSALLCCWSSDLSRALGLLCKPTYSRGLPGQLAPSWIQPIRGQGGQEEGRGQVISPSLPRGFSAAPASPLWSPMRVLIPTRQPCTLSTPLSLFCPASPRGFDSFLLLPVSHCHTAHLEGFRSCNAFMTSFPSCLLPSELPGVPLFLTDTGWILRMSPNLLGFTLDWISERCYLICQQQTPHGQPLSLRATPRPGLAHRTHLPPQFSPAGFPSTASRRVAT